MAQAFGSTHQPATAESRTTALSASTGPSERQLLTCGIVAGPLFVALGVAQALTVPGFDLRRHALSLLETGPFGGVQVANFVASGVLLVAFAVGLRRALYRGPGGAWAPVLIGLC